MNDIHLPPDQRFKNLYSQMESLSIYEMDVRLQGGTKIKMMAKAGASMILKIKNDFRERNYWIFFWGDFFLFLL